MRTLASQEANADQSIDEEAYFTEIASDYLRGITYEVSKIFGPEKATELLNIWRAKKI